MPSTKIKWGNWVDLPNDKVRVMWGGWVAPRLIYVKDGTGTWRDTGYTSAPGPIINLGVSAWSYSSVTFVWNGPSAGAGLTAPHHYEYVITDVNGNWYHNAYTTTGGTATYNISADTRYQFYVRSVSAAGLVSAWVGIKIGIGHPAQTAQRWAQRSTPWSTGFSQYGLSNGAITGQSAPGLDTGTYGFAIGVYVTDMKLEIWTPYGWPTLWGLGRSAYWLGNGAADIGGAMQNLDVNLPFGPSWVTTPFRPRWSNGGAWGIWVSGDGYDHKYGPYLPIYENVQLSGTYYYAELENYTSVAEAGNYTW